MDEALRPKLALILVGLLRWMTTLSLSEARYGHTATLLQNGQVLVAGGYNSPSRYLASAELYDPDFYDPSSETWTTTGSLHEARDFHTATLLENGQVLVAGGYNSTSGGALASAELYDPSSGRWTTTGSLQEARDFHTATLLENGQVLIAGGVADSIVPIDEGYDFSRRYLTSAELYDPSSGRWTTTIEPMQEARDFHTATLLENGQVLVAGGGADTSGGPLASAELYDPSSGRWTTTIEPMQEARDAHTATLLQSGQVLVAGGYNSTSGTLTSVELYDPSSRMWTTIGSLQEARGAHTATLLPTGQVLVAGGI